MPQNGDIGIDLGTSNVMIYAKGKGIVLREPAVIAVDRNNRKPLAVGSDAYRMIGRTPGNVLALRPLRNGAVADQELVSLMLRSFVGNVAGKHFFSRPHAVISVPTGLNDMDKRNINNTMLDLGMGKTQLLDKCLAAALGVGLQFQEAYGTMIIDMGGGVTDIAVLSMGEIVVASCVPLGGDVFDDAIIRYLRKKHNLLIGERTAEEIKINIGSAVPQPNAMAMDVTGRNLISGLPKTQTISSTEIYEALVPPVADLIEAIQAVIERTPPQLASDIFDDGIVMTGGAAALTGLADAVYTALKIPCAVADDPQTSVVMGCGRALENLAGMKALLSDSRRGRLR